MFNSAGGAGSNHGHPPQKTYISPEQFESMKNNPGGAGGTMSGPGAAGGDGNNLTELFRDGLPIAEWNKLRDEFAMAAMASILRNYENPSFIQTAIIAEKSYQQATAMMAERSHHI